MPDPRVWCARAQALDEVIGSRIAKVEEQHDALRDSVVALDQKLEAVLQMLQEGQRRT